MSATGDREGRAIGRSERRAESCTRATEESIADAVTPYQHVPPQVVVEPVP